MKRKTIIIAEIGENYLGDIDIAKLMIDEVSRAGADVVKFQSYLASDASYNDPEKELFEKVQLTDNAHFELKKYTESKGIEFMSSPFSINRVRFLCEELGLKKIKIASSMLTNFSVLDYINIYVDTVFLSTGMANLKEIDDALQCLWNVDNIYIMHCTSQYPTLHKDTNLHAITTIKDAFPKYHVGYSDHTIGIQAVLTAVALGAEVVEKHFTLDRNQLGTDHNLSVDPDGLREVVKMIEEIEILLGSYDKKPTKEEEAIKSFMRNRFHGGNK